MSRGHGDVKRLRLCVHLLCLQILLRAVSFFVVLLVLFCFCFLINDSFLAFVTSSSLLVAGTTQSLSSPPTRCACSRRLTGRPCFQTRLPIALVDFSPRDVKELKLPLSTELKTASGVSEDQRYTGVLAAYQLFFLSPP